MLGVRHHCITAAPGRTCMLDGSSRVLVICTNSFGHTVTAMA